MVEAYTRENPTRQRRIILITLIRLRHPLLEISSSDLRVLELLAANTIVVSINSQPLVRKGVDERTLLVHVRLGIARVVDEIFDVAGAVTCWAPSRPRRWSA
jgi:hypothetical protein